MTNLQTATTAVPSVLVAQYVPATGAAQYQPPAGAAAQLASVRLTNNDSVSRTVKVVVVKSGGTAGATPAFLPTVTVPAGQVVDLGEMVIGDGDFLWAEASSASTVGIIITGFEFSSATGAVLTGIQDDAIGTFGRTTSSGTVTSNCAIGTANNRYLFGALMCTQLGTATAWATYDTLTMSCTAGAMTRLVSIDFTVTSSTTGSVHIFGKANPTSSSTQTLTANVADAGVTFNLALASLSKSGVASTSGATSTGPSAAAAMSLGVTSAVGNVPLIAAVFNSAPQDFAATGSVARVRHFNGNASGFNAPNWMVLADALGAATVTFSAASQFHAAVGLNLVPA